MSSNTIGIITMLRMLNDGECSVTKIVEQTGLYRQTVLRYLKLMHEKELVRIARWYKVGRKVYGCYEWNSDGLTDAARPKPLSKAEVNLRYKQRKMKRDLQEVKHAN